jgi:hypothetical protein
VAVSSSACLVQPDTINNPASAAAKVVGKILRRVTVVIVIHILKKDSKNKLG